MAAPIDITIALDDAAVDARLAALAAAGEDLTPAMAEISRYLVTEIGFRFATEKGPDGVPWIKSKRAKDEGGQTLTDKADLRRSMREDYGRDYAAAGPEASGGAAVYAAVHQFGYQGPIVVPFHTRQVTSRFGKPLGGTQTEFVSSYTRQMNLPARPYLGFNDEDGVEVIEILRGHMGAALGGAA